MRKTIFTLLGVLTMGLGDVTLAKENKVLVALSGVGHISLREGGLFKTGLFLSELTEAVSALIANDYTVVFANPNGLKPAIDPSSDSAKWFANELEFKNAKEQLLSQKGFEAPRRFDSFKDEELDTFSGIFVPGGYAPMEDLSTDAALGKIFNFFHAKSRPTALICHGPIALLAQKAFAPNSAWAYAGYNLTIVSKAEEKEEEDAGHLGGHQLYFVEEALRNAKAEVVVAKPWSSHVVKDREVITGQNPMSAKALVAAFLNELHKMHRF